MKEFTLFWKDGRHQLITGENISDAMRKNGITQFHLVALSFYEDGDTFKHYTFKEFEKEWSRLF